MPKKVEIKGFVRDWNKRDEQSLTSNEATQFLAKLTQDMSANTESSKYISLINEGATHRYLQRLLYSKVPLILADGTSKEQAYELKECINNVIKSSTQYSTWPGLYCTVEASQERKPIHSAGGRAMGWLRMQGMADTVYKPVWASHGVTIFDVRAERPIPLFVWSTTAGWDMKDEAILNLVPSANLESCRQYLVGP